MPLTVTHEIDSAKTVGKEISVDFRGVATLTLGIAVCLLIDYAQDGVLDGSTMEWLLIGAMRLEQRAAKSRELPDDPELPALGEIRTRGLAETLPELGLREEPAIQICNHHPGSRATLEVQTLNRRFAVKIYADDPAPEVEAYHLLAVNGLASDYGPRVPRILSWDRDRRMLALSWLEGPTVNRLVRDGKGRRAGELAAAWLRAASRLDGGIGPPRSGGYMLYRVGMAVIALTATDAGLGSNAMGTANILVRTQPEEGKRYLVHGTLYGRHIFDTGDGPGVIDWDKVGQGPLEMDAGMFLATISRTAWRHKDSADEAERALEALLEGTRGLVDPSSLEWYWAASLLRLSARGVETEVKPRPTSDANSFVAEATRHAEHLEKRNI
jgi:hypothetical protein